MNQFPVSLTGLLLPELEKVLSAGRPPLPRFRVMQIYKWITRGVFEFDQMTDIPKALREELKSRFALFSSIIESCHSDRDTQKIVLALQDGLKVESVMLNDEKKRITACLSTQAGCPAGCVFCKTGSLKFHRNLSCEEIVEQFMHLHRMAVQTKGSAAGEGVQPAIDNIVVMGMGEPLLNLEQLRRAIAVFTDPDGIGFSRRRITVSTCGICSALFDIAENGLSKGAFVRLALSLTTADEPLRQKLMPVTAANPLQRVKEALVLFQRGGGGRITLEVPLLGGINTRVKDAESIAAFAKGIEVVVNIIPWNPVAGLEFEGNPLCQPSKTETESFVALLKSHGLKVTMRHRKGRSVLGACGQLGAKTI